jgi:hypothetical protein
LRAVFHSDLLGWDAARIFFFCTATVGSHTCEYKPSTIRIGLETKQPLKFLNQLDIGKDASPEQQFRCPRYTVVIDNSITNVEQFGLHPIECFRGRFFQPPLDRWDFASLAGCTTQEYKPYGDEIEPNE